MSSTTSGGTSMAGFSSSHLLRCSSSLNCSLATCYEGSVPSSSWARSASSCASYLASNSYNNVKMRWNLQLWQQQDRFPYFSLFLQKLLKQLVSPPWASIFALSSFEHPPSLALRRTASTGTACLGLRSTHLLIRALTLQYSSLGI